MSWRGGSRSGYIASSGELKNQLYWRLRRFSLLNICHLILQMTHQRSHKNTILNDKIGLYHMFRVYFSYTHIPRTFARLLLK